MAARAHAAIGDAVARRRSRANAGWLPQSGTAWPKAPRSASAGRNRGRGGRPGSREARRLGAIGDGVADKVAGVLAKSSQAGCWRGRTFGGATGKSGNLRTADWHSPANPRPPEWQSPTEPSPPQTVTDTAMTFAGAPLRAVALECPAKPRLPPLVDGRRDCGRRSRRVQRGALWRAAGAGSRAARGLSSARRAVRSSGSPSAPAARRSLAGIRPATP